MKFFKYQACGNDYVHIDCFEQIVENPEDLAKKFRTEILEWILIASYWFFLIYFVFANIFEYSGQSIFYEG